jgi:hypothetical protein
MRRLDGSILIAPLIKFYSSPLVCVPNCLGNGP